MWILITIFIFRPLFALLLLRFIENYFIFFARSKPSHNGMISDIIFLSLAFRPRPAWYLSQRLLLRKFRWLTACPNKHCRQWWRMDSVNDTGNKWITFAFAHLAVMLIIISFFTTNTEHRNIAQIHEIGNKGFCVSYVGKHSLFVSLYIELHELASEARKSTGNHPQRFRDFFQLNSMLCFALLWVVMTWREARLAQQQVEVIWSTVPKHKFHR